jgi:microtubule-associated protein-like 6
MEPENEHFDDGEHFEAHTREKFDRATGEYQEVDMDARDKPEDDFFEFDVTEVDAGKEFLAVKPWVGAVVAPSDPPATDKSQPDVQYTLEYAYGYRSADTKMNLYYNPKGNLVYMTACLGIILDKESNT